MSALVNTVSYCSNCKGRLWQLKQVLDDNVKNLQLYKGAEWIILDNACPDDPLGFVLQNPLAKSLVEDEVIKLYRLTYDTSFSMPLAKNLAHLLSNKDIVFNLDIDNFIGLSYATLARIPNNFFTLTRGRGPTGSRGRIGLYRELFLEMRGYDLALEGYGADDICLRNRLLKRRMCPLFEMGFKHPIYNTPDDSMKLVDTDLNFEEINYLNLEKALCNRVINPDGMDLYKGIHLMPFIKRVGTDNVNID